MIYHLFISHSWKYSNLYERLTNLLDQTYGFNYRDYSVPETDPIVGARTDKQLAAEIREQIRCSSCVLVPAGIYISHSKWIQFEIETAKEMQKPIIAIEPYGAEHSSQIAKDAADMIVGWNTNSIVGAITLLC